MDDEHGEMRKFSDVVDEASEAALKLINELKEKA